MSALREGQNAVINGGGGATGGPVARPFARKSARLFALARTLERLEEVGRETEADTAASDTPGIASTSTDGDPTMSRATPTW